MPCHGPRGSAPFDLSTFHGVKSRAELIRTEMLSRNMPPIWVHSEVAKMSMVEQPTDQDLVDLQKWISSGMPEGMSTTRPNGSFPIHKTEFSMSMVDSGPVKAEAAPYWSVITKSLPSTGGAFQGFKIVPNSPLSIRSAIVAIVPRAMKVPKETFGSLNLPSKYLVGVWAPGYKDWNLPDNLSRTFGKDSKLVVQVQYRPTGKPESSGFKVEFFKRGLKSSVAPTWLTLENPSLVIPAGKSIGAELSYRFPKANQILSILPEARFYAGRVTVKLRRANGEEKILLENLRWDPYWIGNYMPNPSVSVQPGDEIRATYYYNNDDKCRANEGKPIRDIKMGPGATDEVCRLHLMLEK